jgi:tRNA A37 N6-isopentenylltransferase MiaA
MTTYQSSFILAGPSTTGKTDIAFAIAEELGGELINADKFYIIRGFPTMTGLPNFLDHPSIKHHLYQIADPNEKVINSEEFSGMVMGTESEIIRRGNLPIIEGCYHQFTRVLLDSEREHILIGIKWRSLSCLEDRVRQRVETIFESEGIKEVEQGLKNGWRDTYVMKKGSMIKPAVEYLDGNISLTAAKEKAVADITYAALKAYRRFLDIPEIRWIENDPEKPQQAIDQILEIVNKSC